MSVLEHRLQVLISEEQKAALDRESAASGRSIGAIVRGAIDLHYASGDERRKRAATAILERTSNPDEPTMEWHEIKASILEAIDARLPQDA